MATARFVEVPASAIRERLVGAGFRLLHAPGSSEEIYGRSHDSDDRYLIKVYSSIRRGRIRSCGADAIRVVAVLVTEKKTYPIFKAQRVYRTGSVEKVLDRMPTRLVANTGEVTDE